MKKRIKNTLKRILPKWAPTFYAFVKYHTVDYFAKLCLIKKVKKNHKRILEQLKTKEKIKVLFYTYHPASWKGEFVIRKMLNDPYFDVSLIIIPSSYLEKEAMFSKYYNMLSFLKEKGFPVIENWLEKENRWLTLKEIAPDIIISFEPHNQTISDYYENAYENYLSCYMPYHHEDDNKNFQYNQKFHNAQWKIFSAHTASLDVYKQKSVRKGQNVEVVGYSMAESFFKKQKTGNYTNPWKNNDTRLKIIWAPHHSIGDLFYSQSTFLLFSEFFKELAIEYKDKIFWAFKPHPGLIRTLYKHPDWGKEKADKYYSFWDNTEFSQLVEESNYEDLFLTSDAMIHDSGSFLIEYLYMLKPVMYLRRKNDFEKFRNDLSKEAIKACCSGFTEDDIRLFIEELLNGEMQLKKEHKLLYENKILPYFQEEYPSDRIVSIIKNGIKK